VSRHWFRFGGISNADRLLVGACLLVVRRVPNCMYCTYIRIPKTIAHHMADCPRMWRLMKPCHSRMQWPAEKTQRRETRGDKGGKSMYIAFRTALSAQPPGVPRDTATSQLGAVVLMGQKLDGVYCFFCGLLSHFPYLPFCLSCLHSRDINPAKFLFHSSLGTSQPASVHGGGTVCESPQV
jgi:hypothetical protein